MEQLTGLADFFAASGSPVWWIVVAVAATVFLAVWARAIKILLPFVGAGTVLGAAAWALDALGYISLNF